jgi:hypothetical protein
MTWIRNDSAIREILKRDFNHEGHEEHEENQFKLPSSNLRVLRVLRGNNYLFLISSPAKSPSRLFSGVSFFGEVSSK